MIKKFFWALLGVLIVAPIAGSLVQTKLLQFKAMGDAAAQMVMPPVTVNVAEVRKDTWQPRIPAVGSVVAVQGIDVSTEVEGVVREIRFKEGSAVKAGEVLVQLDTEIEQARLKSAQATAELAVVNFKRSKELVETRSVSQQEYDSAQSSMKQAVAEVENLRAVIAKKTVRAPFAGELGIRKLSVGQFLERGSPVVSLQSMDPVYVEFSLPQQRLGEVKEGLKVEVESDAYSGETFKGTITAINPELDDKTRNVRVQATLTNADGRLRPGMFVSVDVLVAKTETVLFLPTTAVQHAPYGDSVFVVEESDEVTSDGKKQLKVRQQFVRLGARQGDFTVVNEGVKAGEKVVSTGAFKLRQGMAVAIDEKLAPEFKLEPNPKNT